ncbi:5-formyltetrahydrofolate cyclo-ligase [Mobilisporobacter senegalensis]|uniref:5-formyltetrahydrofolate cyclo-ligase n=1 Tax=Mobilisporobacter senegalensis TaxID=1329262 RepID=A0A3N1XRQ5_9FIRM|nr:5-formyltetrahydrofolate cyclo-ligase [Mobilisporobacter senegalensis]ROR29315.1 5-formyltetrahydrofolate cyclo-ligase [Mobilisporobacter senegalensis]
MTKNEIRRKMKSLKSTLTADQITEYSNNIFHRLEDFISLDNYDAIYTYIAFNEEVQTNPIVHYGFRNKLKIAVPKIVNKQMDFYYIKQMEELKIGFYGILEPDSHQKAIDDHVLMIMPGLAFDEECNRIGYGAGYYDRYLMANKHLSIHKIALAYDFQIVDQLEVNPYDIKVDHIITPTRVIHKRSD